MIPNRIHPRSYLRNFQKGVNLAQGCLCTMPSTASSNSKCLSLSPQPFLQKRYYGIMENNGLMDGWMLNGSKRPYSNSAAEWPSNGIWNRILENNRLMPMEGWMRNELKRPYSSSAVEWPSGRVRKTFLDHFNAKGYRLVPPVPLHKTGQKGLFFVNAGMVQFKDIFLGKASGDLAQLKCAVNSQKCVRASGKLNDLEEVGRDGTHQTFFEMLGHWSFNGHVDRKTACSHAWDLLIQVYGIPEDHLYVSYFAGDSNLNLPEDLPCRDMWISLGVPESRLKPMGVRDNFWQMAETGPCGPCTEIHYKNPENGREFELWNLVFIDFNRTEPGGQLIPLPNHHIDTGMGFERLVTVLQGASSNYQTDLFRPYLDLIHKVIGGEPYRDRYASQDSEERDCNFRILADHSRMFTMALADGVLPHKEGPGHVLRKIMRNAYFAARSLAKPDYQNTKGLLEQLACAVIDNLHSAYPELEENRDKIIKLVHDEEKKAVKVVTQGKKILYTIIKQRAGDPITTNDLFLLFNAYGLPKSVILELAKKNAIEMNIPEFDQMIAKQRATGKHEKTDDFNVKS